MDFRDSICGELRRNREGLTWNQLKERLDLPYRTPCGEWVGRMEKENGLVRAPGPGRGYIWRILDGG
ncbi:MAG: hypothetical protein JXR55_08820 [Candidatus Fermentibacteraceae bacterium]|nr:hypothetical protein [Candidatus Fermentibacteraceae bacterium]